MLIFKCEGRYPLLYVSDVHFQIIIVTPHLLPDLSHLAFIPTLNKLKLSLNVLLQIQ